MRSMTGAECPSLPAHPQYCVASQRNISLGRRQRWALFATLATLSLGFALAFAAAGAWLVLPYSAIEITLLAVAFAYIERRAGDWERLTVAGDRVVLERSIAGRVTRHEWNRPWLVVATDADGIVRLGSENVAFGATMPAVQRFEVGRTLRRIAAAR